MPGGNLLYTHYLNTGCCPLGKILYIIYLNIGCCQLGKIIYIHYLKIGCCPLRKILYIHYLNIGYCPVEKNTKYPLHIVPTINEHKILKCPKFTTHKRIKRNILNHFNQLWWCVKKSVFWQSCYMLLFKTILDNSFTFGNQAAFML